MKILTDAEKTREQNRAEVKAIVQNMCLMDDDFMSMVLQHKECLELVLNIILDRKDIRVRECKTQYSISSLYGRSARLDVFAEDKSGRLYDIEVQNIVNADEIKRIRFYSALMDANYLSKNDKPKELRETYVIFILGKDMYDDGLPIYHVDRVVRETGRPFEDDLHILLVNSRVQDKTALGKLMSDFHCREPEKMNYGVLLEQANYYKRNEKGESVMCEMVERYADRRAQEAAKIAAEKAAEKAAKIASEKTAKEEKTEFALRMLSKGKFSYEEIAEMTTLAIREVERLASEMGSK